MKPKKKREKRTAITSISTGKQWRELMENEAAARHMSLSAYIEMGMRDFIQNHGKTGKAGKRGKE